MGKQSEAAWRLSFVMGEDDYSEAGVNQGIAVIGSWCRVDLTIVPRSEFRRAYLRKCRALDMTPSSSNQSSHSKFLYDMNPGDVVYVKSKGWVVAKGIVAGSPDYNKDARLLKGSLSKWAYFRRVKWQKDFPPIPKDLVPLTFIPPQQPVLRLEGKRLAELMKGEKQVSQ